ncbi:hypothetical protein Tco_0902680 [Tanacetum coccineum]
MCIMNTTTRIISNVSLISFPSLALENHLPDLQTATALENSKVSFSIPTGGIYGELGVNTFRNAIGAHYLLHSNEYVAPPSIDVIWAERIPQDTKPEAKPGHKKHSTSKQPPVSSSKVTKGGSFKAPTGSKTGHLKRKKESNSAMDFNPSQTSASTLVVAEMHKEDQQATGGPTSLGVTSEAKANPQLSSDKTKFVNVWLETVLTKPKTGTTNVAKTSKEIKFGAIKLEDLAKLVPNVKVDFKDLDSPEDDSINVVDDSKGNGEEDKNEEIHSTTNDETEDISDSTPPSPRLKAQPSFPYVGQLNELLVKSLTAEFSKILSAQDFSSSLPTELKDLPFKFDELTEEVKGHFSLLLNVTKALNKFAQVLDSVSSKARDQSVSSVDKGKKAMSSEEAEKESTNSDSNDETHVTGSMVEPSRTKKLKKFDFITEDGRHIHLTEEEINHQKKLEEDAKPEAAKQEGEVRKAKLFDLIGPEVVKKYYNDKLQYDRNCDKMLNRRAISKITKCDVLTKKGPITLKVYREDGTSEIIPNFKASDLHLGKWREVMKACPNRTRKGYETIYKQIGARMDYIHTTEAELGINLDTPLSKQDPLNKLNDLVNKKRKHADDIHDYFKANKRLKSSVQYKDHFPGTVLNEPVIGPKLDDHARTFSSLLLAEVDKRNINSLKQMRFIEQLRQ